MGSRRFIAKAWELTNLEGPSTERLSLSKGVRFLVGKNFIARKKGKYRFTAVAHWNHAMRFGCEQDWLNMMPESRARIVGFFVKANLRDALFPEYAGNPDIPCTPETRGRLEMLFSNASNQVLSQILNDSILASKAKNKDYAETLERRIVRKHNLRSIFREIEMGLKKGNISWGRKP